MIVSRSIHPVSSSVIPFSSCLQSFQASGSFPEDEVLGWHHWLNGHEFEQTSGVGDGQGSLVCCSPLGREESDMIQWLNWTEVCPCCCKWHQFILFLWPSSIPLCFPGGSMAKSLPSNAEAAGDPGSISGMGRSPGGENSNPLQYSC